MKELKILTKIRGMSGPKIAKLYHKNYENTVEMLLDFVADEIKEAKTNLQEYNIRHIFMALRFVQEIYDELYELDKKGPYTSRYYQLYEDAYRLGKSMRTKEEEPLYLPEELYITLTLLQDVETSLKLVEKAPYILLTPIDDTTLMNVLLQHYEQSLKSVSPKRYETYLRFLKRVLPVIERYPDIETKMYQHLIAFDEQLILKSEVTEYQKKNRMHEYGLLRSKLKSQMLRPQVPMTISIEPEVKKNILQPIVTIDNVNTKLKEDALSFRKVEDGYDVTLYITDVTNVLKEHPQMDTRACSRWFSKTGNDLYTTSDIANYFSLDVGKKRPVVTYQFHFDQDYRLRHLTFGRAEIAVTHSYTYNEIEQILNHTKKSPIDFSSFYGLAECYHKGNSHKLEYTALRALCNQIGQTEQKTKNQYDVMLIVSEMKNLANYYQAKFCDDNQIPLMHYVNGFDASVDEMQTMMKDLKTGTSIEHFNQMALQSQYRLAVSPHKGLGYDTYTHATTPVRNYFAGINQNIFLDVAYQKHYQKIPYYRQYLEELEELQRSHEVQEYEKYRQKKKRKIHKIKGVSYQKEIDKIESALKQKVMTIDEIIKLTELPELTVKEVVSYLKDELHLDEVNGSYHLLTNENHHVGVYQKATNEYGFVVLENGEKVLVPEQHRSGVRNGGTVLVETYGKEKRKAARILRQKQVRERAVGNVVTLDDTYYVALEQKGMTHTVELKNLNGAKVNDIVVVELVPGKKTQSAEVIRVIGNKLDPHAGIYAILESYGVSTTFPKEILEAVEEVPGIVTEDECIGRVDFRDQYVFTMDGKTAKDFDDAISITVNARSEYILGVHIADVSHYVKEDSVIDLDARERSTSVYVADIVAPMLHPKLSNGICSLNPHEDRLTLSCLMTFDAQGNRIRYEIVPGVIRSKKRMTYEDVNEVLEGKHLPEYQGALCHIRHFQTLSRLIRKQREHRGALFFEIPETKFILDESGKAIGIAPQERKEAERMIEEAMIAANECFADFMKRSGMPSSYRVHAEPEYKSLKEAFYIMKELGV